MKPKWLKEKSIQQRARDGEKKQAKSFHKGKAALGSGATLGQNDVFNDDYEVEMKLTGKDSYPLKVATWGKLLERTHTSKTPLMIIEFEGRKKLVVMDYDDFVNLANS
jgi:hypothetical protein